MVEYKLRFARVKNPLKPYIEYGDFPDYEIDSDDPAFNKEKVEAYCRKLLEAEKLDSKNYELIYFRMN